MKTRLKYTLMECCFRGYGTYISKIGIHWGVFKLLHRNPGRLLRSRKHTWTKLLPFMLRAF